MKHFLNLIDLTAAEPTREATTTTTVEGNVTENVNKTSNIQADERQEKNNHGVDVNISGRMRNSLMFQGGTSTGRLVTDECEIREKLPETGPVVAGGSSPRVRK